MSPYRDAADLEGELLAFLARFLDPAGGAAAAAALAAVEGSAVLEIAVTDPDATVHVDLKRRAVASGPGPDAAARVRITATGLHDLLLDRLGPVEISRLLEEDDLALAGPPPALAGLLLVAEPLRRHYEASLTERGRDDLLSSPAPEVGGIWETDVTPPRVFGIRRPWQPEKSDRAQRV
jgi:hypothetical protein